VIPRVLSIAASDSSGAAGMQADLKTFEARQVYGMSALTAVTAQNSKRIGSMQVFDAEFVALQIGAVLADIGVDAIKTGLLLRREVVDAVWSSLQNVTPNLIVDPVFVAGNGQRLVDDATVTAYTEKLFKIALIVTPNLDEARILTGIPVTDLGGMRETAGYIHDMGPKYVLVKGGHLGWGDRSFDVLYDGETFTEFRAVRLPIRNARGAGCTFASCIAAEVAKGRTVLDAVGIAKRYVTVALTAAAGWKLGQGRNTLFHSTGRPPIFNEPQEER
jgi:hydroxymethylpyrimidine/phosphomethylpyrimidine kinase